MQSNKYLYHWISENWDSKVYPKIIEVGFKNACEDLSVMATKDGVITINNVSPSPDNLETGNYNYKKKLGLPNTKQLKIRR